MGIIPPPTSVPFVAFNARLEISFGRSANDDAFALRAGFTLASASNGIDPVREPVKLEIRAFAITIPAGSFKGDGFGPFSFHGVIDGLTLEARIMPTGSKRYALEVEARGANLAGTKNPVAVAVSIGANAGSTSIKADLDREREDRDGHRDREAFNDETDHRR